MLRILIIEDNPVDTALLRNKLTETGLDIQTVGNATNVLGAIELIIKYNPNVLILDVRLGLDSSFSIFNHINFKDYEIIFYTGHEDYALSAFDVEAIGYLIKPADSVQLKRVLILAQQNISHKQILTIPKITAEKTLRAVSQNTITVPFDNGFDIVPINEIMRCEAIHSTTHIFMAHNATKLVSSYNIGKFYEILINKGFFLAHRSHIVNLTFVKKYLRNGIIIMRDDTEIPISRSNRQSFVGMFTATAE